MPKFDVSNPTEVVVEAIEPKLYTHSTIREKTHEQLIFRLDNIRNRRLVAAIEYKADSDRKRAIASAKLLSQYQAVNDRNRQRLNRLDELIEDVDRGIGKQIELSHKISLMENE